jgi:hypothetical protein
MYVLSRGRLAVDTAAAGFSRETVGQDQMLAIAAVMATHLELIRVEVLASAQKWKSKNAAEAAVFAAAANSLSGNAAVMVASIKAFAADPSKEARMNAHMFTKPTIASIDALISFAANAKFIGTPPQVNDRPLASPPTHDPSHSLVCSLFGSRVVPSLDTRAMTASPLTRIAPIPRCSRCAERLQTSSSRCRLQQCRSSLPRR